MSKNLLNVIQTKNDERRMTYRFAPVRFYFYLLVLQFYFYLLVLQLVLCRVGALKSLPVQKFITCLDSFSNRRLYI